MDGPSSSLGGGRTGDSQGFIKHDVEPENKACTSRSDVALPAVGGCFFSYFSIMCLRQRAHELRIKSHNCETARLRAVQRSGGGRPRPRGSCVKVIRALGTRRPGAAHIMLPLAKLTGGGGWGEGSSFRRGLGSPGLPDLRCGPVCQQASTLSARVTGRLLALRLRFHDSFTQNKAIFLKCRQSTVEIDSCFH